MKIEIVQPVALETDWQIPYLNGLIPDKPGRALESICAVKYQDVLGLGERQAALRALLSTMSRAEQQAFLLATYLVLLIRFGRSDVGAMELSLGNLGRDWIPAEPAAKPTANTQGLRLLWMDCQPSSVSFLQLFQMCLSSLVDVAASSNSAELPSPAELAKPADLGFAVVHLPVESSEGGNTAMPTIDVQNTLGSQFTQTALSAGVVLWDQATDPSMALARLHFSYNANIFDLNTVKQLADSYQVLLAQCAASMANAQAHPTREMPAIGSYELLDAAAKLAAIQSSSGSTNHFLQSDQQHSLDPWQHLCNELQPARAERENKIAIHFFDANTQLQAIRYRQLWQSVAELEQSLAASGVSHADHVGLYCSLSPQAVVALLAVMRLGAVYVPLDPSYPKKRIDYMIADAKLTLIVTDRPKSFTQQPNTKITILDGRVPDLLIVSDNKGNAGQGAGSPRPSEDSASMPPAGGSTIPTPAYVMYTSGTTGVPKGVIGTHLSVLNRLLWMRVTFPVEPGEVLAARASVSCVDHIAEVLQPLVCGVALAILPSAAAVSNKSLLEQLVMAEVTRLSVLPSQLKKLLQDPAAGQLTSLKWVFSSGEVLFQQLVEQFHLHFRGSVQLVNLYGSTETGADVSFQRLPYPRYLDVLRYFEHLTVNSLAHPTEATASSRDSYQQLNTTHRVDGNITAPDIAIADLREKFLEVEIPTKPRDLESYLESVQRDLLPYLVNVSSSKFIGHMTSALPSFVPEFSRFISRANQNLVKVETSKALTLLERQLMAMLHRQFYQRAATYYRPLVQDPNCVFGIVTSGGSLANLTALFCARNSGLINSGICKQELQRLGAIEAMQRAGYGKAKILVSRLAHYSIRKSVGLLGLGEDNLILIEQDQHQRIKTAELHKKIAACRADGDFIIAIIGIAGATETGTIDPLPAMARIAQQYHIHFHVDAAWGGAFILSNTYKHKLAGIELADTITFCAHKQLYLAQGISVCLFRDPKSIFSIATHADYQATNGSFDLGQFTLEGSRPAASLMLHASLHLFSQCGYEWMLDQSMAKTAYLRDVIRGSEGFELVGENDLNIINYRYLPKAVRTRNHSHSHSHSHSYSDAEHAMISAATDKIQEQQFLNGKTFVSKTKIIHSRFSDNKISVFRVVPINPMTSFDDLVAVLTEQLHIADQFIEKSEHTQALFAVEQNRMDITRAHQLLAPIGRPIANSAIYVLDEQLKLLPDGVIGELYVAGDGLALGYLNLTDAQHHSFVPDPHLDTDFSAAQTTATDAASSDLERSGMPRRLYRTGDRGKRVQGVIEFCGRSDQQVKLSGQRIELQEIEAVISRLAGDQITAVKAVVLPQDRFGTEPEAALSVYIESALVGAKQQQLKQFISEQSQDILPVAMQPEHLVVSQNLPKLPNGKIDVGACAQLFAAQWRVNPDCQRLAE